MLNQTICTSYKGSILTVECLLEINFTEEHIKASSEKMRVVLLGFQGCKRALLMESGMDSA